MADNISTSLSGGVAGQQNSYTPGPNYQDGLSLGNGTAIFSGLLKIAGNARYPILTFRSIANGAGINMDLSADGNTVVISSNAIVPNYVFYSPNSDISVSTTNTVVAFGLPNTAVVAGSYTNASFVVDSKGRILTASNGTVDNTGVSVGIVSQSDILVTNSPVTNSGTISIDLTNTGVTPGTYSFATIEVDAKGRVRTIATGDLGNAGLPNGTVTTVIAQGSTSISVAGSPITTAGVLSFDLTNSGVVAGTYSLATVVVDNKGRIHAAVSGATTDLGVVRVDAKGIGSNSVLVTGGPITGDGTFVFDLSATSVTAGTYAAATIGVDAQGRIQSATAGVVVPQVTVNANDFTINGSNVTGAGNFLTATGPITLALNNTGITPGTYSSADLIVDSKGRIRGINNGGAGGTVHGVTLVSQGPGLHVEGNTITTSGTYTLSLVPSGVTPGTYFKAVVDEYGRVVSGQTSLTMSDIISALGYTPVTANAPTFSGFAHGATAAPGNNSTVFATTAFVQGEIANAVAYLLSVINS